MLMLYARPCLRDSHCQTRNPCTLDTCEKNWCVHTMVDNCCLSDNDCGRSGCYTTFCDMYRHTCQAYPKDNGTACDDGNACTVDNTCMDGVCVGKTLTCNVENQCRSGTCEKGIGCVFENAPNGVLCDDSNPCTSADECYNGMCAVGVQKDCTSLDTMCSVGACDVTTGDCIRTSINEGMLCDDGVVCTINDRCTNGVCQGETRTCFDNNPCTINRCTEDVGCVVEHTDDNETCIPGCLIDADCPLSYNCLDGTCLQTEELDNQHIRMIGYEIESCNASFRRLSQHFVLDTERFTVGNDTRYRVVKSAADITVHPLYSDLGFGSSIVNFAHNDFGNGIARSTFTIKTACQPFNEVNCAYIFTHREFRFALSMHDCVDISGPLALGCIDPSHSIWASISTSISSCSMFGGHIEMDHPRGTAVLHFNETFYRGKEVEILNIDYDAPEVRGTVGIETNMFNATGVYAVITDLRVCKPKSSHYMRHCVDGTNRTTCANMGCFGWDPLDSPLGWQVDIISGREVTAVALSDTFFADGCYENDDYNADTPTICTWNKCTRLGLDDSFEFSFRPFLDSIPFNTFVFDVKYRYHACNLHGRRRLLSTSDEPQYAMKVIHMYSI